MVNILLTALLASFVAITHGAKWLGQLQPAVTVQPAAVTVQPAAVTVQPAGQYQQQRREQWRNHQQQLKQLKQRSSMQPAAAEKPDLKRSSSSRNHQQRRKKPNLKLNLKKEEEEEEHDFSWLNESDLENGKELRLECCFAQPQKIAWLTKAIDNNDNILEQLREKESTSTTAPTASSADNFERINQQRINQLLNELQINNDEFDDYLRDFKTRYCVGYRGGKRRLAECTSMQGKQWKFVLGVTILACCVALVSAIGCWVIRWRFRNQKANENDVKNPRVAGSDQKADENDVENPRVAGSDQKADTQDSEDPRVEASDRNAGTEDIEDSRVEASDRNADTEDIVDSRVAATDRNADAKDIKDPRVEASI